MLPLVRLRAAADTKSPTQPPFTQCYPALNLAALSLVIVPLAQQTSRQNKTQRCWPTYSRLYSHLPMQPTLPTEPEAVLGAVCIYTTYA